ncbi:MAG: AAA family ATPase [Woeseiaceae bacterium]
MNRAGPTQIPVDSQLIDGLMCPTAFGHQVDDVHLRETHISWLILAGEFVYKIKKPIVLDFLDFGSLEKRRFFCDEEIRLNRPWAPDIYLDVVPVTMQDDQPIFGGSGEPIEYAVRMRRFDEDMQLDRQLEQDQLTAEDMQELANMIAKRHQGALSVDDSQRGRVLRLTNEFMWDNFKTLDTTINGETLDTLKNWTKNELRKVETILGKRFDDGFVRDCHGDLHLGNLVRLPDGITTFDCIEFSTDLRHIDVMCDLAFLIMDLFGKGRRDLAVRFLNRYLEVTGDYDGLAVFNLFFVYRCLVRAKVAVIMSQERDDAAAAEQDLAEAGAYCEMALRQAADRTPVLMLMHGLSGSGKTWVSEKLLETMPAIRLRSDIERKRMVAVHETASSDSGLGEGIYIESLNRDVYAKLLTLATLVLEAGHNVILDATYLRESDRAAARTLAECSDWQFLIIDVTARPSVMRQRISRRKALTANASEADLDVLERQIETAEHLTATELSRTITCDNSQSIDTVKILDHIRQLLV